MDKIRRLVLFRIPMSICNFRCHYCYLAQRDECYQGIQPEMKFTPEQVRKAMSKERLGGPAYMNFCADGETLLVTNLDQYIKELVEEGHYAEIVSNMTITPVLEQICSWGGELLSHVEFKCSFHYLELKKRNLLERFAENVNRAWEAGASVTIEVTPSDELIPYIDELKAFSMEHFGALPHLTIARDDRTNGIDYLTNLSMEEYDNVWSQFDSDFWEFKKSIFGIYQDAYCYAGLWSIYIDLTTGDANPCYTCTEIPNVFEHPEKPIDFCPIGKCPIAHCYNGHALLTLGVIPGVTEVRYGDIRDRERTDGTHWLQPELKAFFNTKLEESNKTISKRKKLKDQRDKKPECRPEKLKYQLKNAWLTGCAVPSRAVAKVKQMLRKNGKE